jgi:hypothetical protein
MAGTSPAMTEFYLTLRRQFNAATFTPDGVIRQIVLRMISM